MKAVILMFDSLNRHLLPPYADTFVDAPNFARLAHRAATFDSFYAGSLPCMPARRELHTGRHNFLHRSWGPLEPFDDSMPQLLRDAGVHTHLASDHPHYWEDGGATYHTRYSTWEFFRGQEGDPWKGVVPDDGAGASWRDAMVRQDRVNRGYMPTEADHSQTRTVDAGLHFLDVNAHADRWLLQIELFDPHEPFFTHQPYKDLYPRDYDGPAFDWPGYHKVTEPEEQVEHARREYAALVSMCDRSLGRVLDAMDAHGLWDDTLLIVNTDHGFLLGEHGWWAKSVQPWFNELVHLPMFLWDPRTGGRDERRGDLARTIDIAPTVLRYFGLEPTADMQGRDLALPAGREATALFGIHGGHVNVTDGRYVYMRACDDPGNGPLDEYTLMPTHMRSRFAPDELKDWEPAEPFGFTKGLRTMRVPSAGGWLNPWRHGTLLFDLREDPHQSAPLHDDEVELRMARLLVEAMRGSEAPAAQFARLGLPAVGPVTRAHLHVRAHAERAAAMAEPLPRAERLRAHALLTAPLNEVTATARGRDAVERIAPDLLRTERVALPPGLSLYDLAASGAMTAERLRELDAALAE
ncbi:sulfatase [Nocardiopsis sp. RSe5-2]|uniref:Sulfatase n=1 Tax=Nocardiopsis endophytica TaxID=3018445 RepID=A0ABT4TYN7_9ACTN|nr:sulfatase [Nocardiopsis endophytica]MDA2809359.1 sulfatase [Nocardiopsis endophytica]